MVVAACLLILTTPLLGLVMEWGTSALRWGIETFVGALGLDLNLSAQ